MIQDAHIRQQALNPRESFIVQAPAGSGKTELLTQRYLILLAHAEKSPEEIVAITFTRKSAAEMRARVIQALIFAQESAPESSHYRHTTWTLAKRVLEKDAVLHWNLIQNPNRLRILTIDALATFLLGAVPDITEDAHSLYEEAATRVIADILPDPQFHLHAEQLLLHLDNRVSTLSKLLTHLLDHRDQWLPHIMHGYDNLPKLRKILESSLKTATLEILQATANAFPSELKQTLALLMHHVGETEFVYQELPSIDARDSWVALAHLLLTKDHEWRKTVTKTQGFEKKSEEKTLMLETLATLQSHPAFKKCLIDLLYAPPIIYTDAQWNTLTTITKLLPLLAAQLQIVFQEKNQIDFIELNLAALKALGTEEAPTDLALYLDYQIKHLLIDEFQDTSIVHFRLLEKLVAGWEPGDGRTLFLVGDPMQSIYRFRNAEVGLFLRAQKQGIGNVPLTTLTLTMNFRSQTNLVNWFNTTFSAIFPAVADISTGRVPYTKAIAAQSAIDNQTAYFYPVEPDDVIEAAAVVEKIKAIENKNDTMAILVRTRAQLTSIIYALQAENIAFQAVEIESLSNQMVIQDLLSLTRALLHRADRIAWLAVLRAPWLGLTLADLTKIAQYAENKTIWDALLALDQLTLSHDGLQRLTLFTKIIQDAFQTQTTQLPSQWIKKVWLQLGGPATLSDATQLTHADTYFQLLEQCESDSVFLDIDTLIFRCEKLFATSAQKTHARLHIMTIHKSKGLEFDHVFLPSLHKKSASDKEKLFRWLERTHSFSGDGLILAPMKSSSQTEDPIYDYLKYVEHEKQNHEMRRLLYVASTRAKKSLHLFAQIEWDEKKHTLKTPQKGCFLESLWSIYESEIPKTPLKKITQQKKVSVKKSPQRLSKHYSFPLIISPQTTLHSAHMNLQLPDHTARIVGTVMHEILQTMAEKKEIHWPQWEARLRFLGLNFKTDQFETAVKNLETDPRAQWIFSDQHQHARNEWSLTTNAEGEIKTYVIDRTFIDENNIRWIIDYKTAIPTENESLHGFLENQKRQHESQLNNYAQLLEKLDNRDIQLGLYFPLCGGWIEWICAETLLKKSLHTVI